MTYAAPRRAEFSALYIRVGLLTLRADTVTQRSGLIVTRRPEKKTHRLSTSYFNPFESCHPTRSAYHSSVADFSASPRIRPRSLVHPHRAVCAGDDTTRLTFPLSIFARP
jgi:hypothetical protein